MNLPVIKNRIRDFFIKDLEISKEQNWSATIWGHAVWNGALAAFAYFIISFFLKYTTRTARNIPF